MKRCSFPGCDRPHKALGLCTGHYKQQRKAQELTPLGAYFAAARARRCSAAGCFRRPTGRGLCNTHYAQQYRYNLQPRPIKRPSPPRRCSMDCGRIAFCRGLCTRHYAKQGRIMREQRKRQEQRNGR